MPESTLQSGAKTFFGDQNLLFGLSYFLCVEVGRPPGVSGRVYFRLFGGSFWLALDFCTGGGGEAFLANFLKSRRKCISRSSLASPESFQGYGRTEQQKKLPGYEKSNQSGSPTGFAKPRRRTELAYCTVETGHKGGAVCS